MIRVVQQRPQYKVLGEMDAIGLVVRMPSQEALATAAAIQLACVIADVLVWH